MKVNNHSVHERRKYIRLDSVFPVEFRLISPDEKEFLSDWLQGFTNDISRGGICLSVNNLNPELSGLLREGKAKISLQLEMPINRAPIKARAKAVWINDILAIPPKSLIGLAYEQIDPKQNKKILHYARLKEFFIPSVLAAALILVLVIALGGVLNAKLIKGNKALMNQLVQLAQESSIAKQKIKQISRQRQDLEIKIQALEQRIQAAQEEMPKIADKQGRKLGEQNKLIAQLGAEKDALIEKLIAIQGRENFITEELLRLDKRKAILEKANFDKMYLWIKMHQNPRTGLIMGPGSVYDQSLACQAYIYFSDFERVRKMLDFFRSKAKRQNNLFLNAYNVSSGVPVDSTVLIPSNIWLGITAMQYTDKSGDEGYVGIAEDIAQAIINLKALDKESENTNICAYAFFNMLYKVTGKTQYAEAAAKILDTLLQETKDLIASKYTWLIAGIGPQKLEELGINPDRLLESSDNSQIVSAEQKSQTVIAYKIMSDFYEMRGMIAKSRAYALKADQYLSGLVNEVVSDDSVASKAYTLFAYYNYNPLGQE